MKHSVLELIGSFHQGGSERQAVQLSKLLHAEGSFRVFVGCLDHTGGLDTELSWLSHGDIPEFKLKSFYDANFLRQVHRCAAFIRANGIRVVHTHDFYTNIFGMLAASIARTAVRIASKRETFSKSKAQLRVERQSFRLADRVVANADAVKLFLTNMGVPEPKIVTIHNGLDVDRLTPSANRNREVILKELGLEFARSDNIVTIVANLKSEIKNHRMFLKAARRVRDKISNVAFVLAGEGELTESLRSFAGELGIEKHVFFIGGRRNIPELLAISNVCVLSSRSEGFSNSILEYMSAGKPVVATDVGGAREAVRDSVTGYVVASEDDRAMADRLIQLLEDPAIATRMGNKGRLIVRECFSLEAQTEKTTSLYKSLLSEKVAY